MKRNPRVPNGRILCLNVKQGLSWLISEDLPSRLSYYRSIHNQFSIDTRTSAWKVRGQFGNCSFENEFTWHSFVYLTTVKQLWNRTWRRIILQRSLPAVITRFPRNFVTINSWNPFSRNRAVALLELCFGDKPYNPMLDKIKSQNIFRNALLDFPVKAEMPETKKM